MNFRSSYSALAVFNPARVIFLLFILLVNVCGHLQAQLFTWSPPDGPCTVFAPNNFAQGTNGTLFAAALADGILTSTNDGAMWDYKNAEAAGLFCAEIVAAPDGMLYMRGWDGYYRSSDNGTSWTNMYPVNMGWENYRGKTLALGPSSSVYIAVRDTIYRSTNQGTDWSFLASPAAALADQLNRLLVGNGGELFCESPSLGQVISTDGGSTWFAPQITKGGKTVTMRPASFAYNPASGALYAISSSQLYRSTDAGKTWTFIGAYGDRNTVRPFIMVDAHDKVYVSSGRLLTCFDGLSKAVVKFPKLDKNTGITALLASSQGTLISGYLSIHRYISSSWKDVVVKAGIGWGQDVAFGSDGTLYAAVQTLSDGSVFSYDQAHQSWKQLNAKPLGPISQLIVTKSGKIIASSGYGYYISKDKGFSWKKVKLARKFNFVPAGGVQAANGDIYLLGNGNDGDWRILKSTNDGDKWAVYYSAGASGDNLTGTVNDLILAPSGNFIIAAGAGVHVQDAVTKKFSNHLTDKFHDIAAVAVTTDGTILAGANGSYADGSDAGVYRSTDGGSTWMPPDSSAQGTKGLRIRSMKSGPNGFVVATTGVQWPQKTNLIIYSTDNGLTWSDGSSGLYSLAINVVLRDDGYLYVGTYNRGIQRTAAPVPGVSKTVHSPTLSFNSDVPAAYYLEQNYPNPFNPRTTIHYGIAEDAHVAIAVYDALGQRVAMLADGMQTAGEKTVSWNADGMASGIYFYRIEAVPVRGGKAYIDMKKMILLR